MRLEEPFVDREDERRNSSVSDSGGVENAVAKKVLDLRIDVWVQDINLRFRNRQVISNI